MLRHPLLAPGGCRCSAAPVPCAELVPWESLSTAPKAQIKPGIPTDTRKERVNSKSVFSNALFCMCLLHSLLKTRSGSCEGLCSVDPSSIKNIQLHLSELLRKLHSRLGRFLIVSLGREFSCQTRPTQVGI